MVFEKIGAAQVDENLRALKIEIDKRFYVIGLQDLIEQCVRNRREVGVFQIIEKPVQREVAVTP